MRYRPAMVEPLPPTDCLNCGAPLSSPRPRFCSACGQETNFKPPTLGEFLQQFGGAYFSTEGALWRTLKLLLLKPGELTRQYLAGRRKHYVLPLRLYLTISVVVLLLLRLVATVNIEEGQDKVAAPATTPATTTTQTPKATPKPGVTVHVGPQDEDLKNLEINIGAGRAGMKDGSFFCENLPQWICKRIQRRIDVDPKAFTREMLVLGERFVGNVGSAMFVLLPSFALWLKLVYWNRRLRYTEHLVFALHVHAFWFLALAVAMTNVWWLVAPACAAVPWHTLLAMRRVYGGRRWPRLLRALVVSMLYGITLMLAVVGVGLGTLLS